MKTMYISDLVDGLKAIKDDTKKVLVSLKDGNPITLDILKHVEDEVFYLFIQDGDNPLTVGWLKILLEDEASDECWSHSLFNDNCSRFEDCDVMFVHGIFENFEDSVRSYLEYGIEETDDAVILKCK